MIRGRSLRLRLLLGAAVLITLAVIGTGLALSALFRDHVTAQYDAELTNHLNQLTAALRLRPEHTLALDSEPGDPRFHTPYGGRYWQAQIEGQAALRSRSLWDQSLALEPDTPAAGELHRHESEIPSIGTVRMVERLVRFEEAPTTPIRVATGLPAAEIDAVTARFDRLLALTLAVLALALLAASSLQVAIGLKPLARLGEALGPVRTGAKDWLEGVFPAEVQPLVDELNALLQQQATLIGRARAQAADLAHGLKTSLQLLLLEASRLAAAGNEEGPLIREQVLRMQAVIERQLARARAQGHHRRRAPGAVVATSIEALVRVLVPLAAERGIVIERVLPAQLIFDGDVADLEEMAGNLLDNACKWAAARVRVTARLEAGRLRLVIEDDGRGLDPEQSEAVFMRGRRLDERVPGSGLGLAIVREIAEIYDGEVLLERSAMGGLCAVLDLPGHEEKIGSRVTV